MEKVGRENLDSSSNIGRCHPWNISHVCLERWCNSAKVKKREIQVSCGATGLCDVTAFRAGQRLFVTGGTFGSGFVQSHVWQCPGIRPCEPRAGIIDTSSHLVSN